MWTNPQETADLVTFTERKTFNEKLNFLCSVNPFIMTVSRNSFPDHRNQSVYLEASQTSKMELFCQNS